MNGKVYAFAALAFSWWPHGRRYTYNRKCYCTLCCKFRERMTREELTSLHRTQCTAMRLELPHTVPARYV